MEMKFYSPLTAEFFPDEPDWEDESYNEYEGYPMDGHDLLQYADAVDEAVKKDIADFNGDLMQYYHEDDSVRQKVVSAVPSVEIHGNKLCGCLNVELRESLNEGEQAVLCDYISGQYSDGWGEGFEQRDKEPLLPVLILGLLAFTVLWPLWFTVDGALMASDELTAALGPALLDTADGGYAVWTILPSWPTLQPLAELLLDTPQFFSVFWNTCLLAFAQIAGQLVVAAPASWAFAKLRFAGRRFLLLGYIALMVLPFQVLMVPNYLIATRLGIYDTPLSVILPGVFSAFPVFIMTRSFQDVPNELLEAAKLDGATAWQIFWKIGVPLGYAGIFAALVLNFIEGWNAVEQPLLFLKSQSNWPLSMYMNDIVTDNLGIAMAASLLSLIPAMLVFLYGQTYLELGIQAGGIKA